MRELIWFCIFSFFFPLAVVHAAESEQWEEVFLKANQAYKEGRFETAVDGYNQLIQSGHGNGHVYYNLGNAYIRSGQLGEAILNYERARLVLPNASRAGAIRALDEAFGQGAGRQWAALLERAGRMWDITRGPFLESALEGSRTLVRLSRNIDHVRVVAPWQSLRGRRPSESQRLPVRAA